MNSYPILNLLVTHGRTIALALALLTFAGGILASVETTMIVWAFAGGVGGCLVYGFVASYAELVRLVTDMLLPK
ncbi:MAG TPA: hypothetical protein VG271_08795 [Beijerinckiaceae bacterium]|nr:hypothetical protein [Beijerinckiaceae bacterium]